MVRLALRTCVDLVVRHEIVIRPIRLDARNTAIVDDLRILKRIILHGAVRRTNLVTSNVRTVRPKRHNVRYDNDNNRVKQPHRRQQFIRGQNNISDVIIVFVTQDRQGTRYG